MQGGERAESRRAGTRHWPAAVHENTVLSSPLPYPPSASSVNLVLELAFATKDLRSMCEDAACAEGIYGPVVAKALVGRVADLRAASHPLELPIVEIRASDESGPERIMIALADGRSLVIAANHAKPPRDANGALVWERVSRVIILCLE